MKKPSRDLRKARTPVSDPAGETPPSYTEWKFLSANELERLRKLDPEIIQWVKRRVEIEQEERFTAVHRRLDILEGRLKYEFLLDRLAMYLAFLVIACGLTLASIFVVMRQQITGTLFAGVTIFAAAGVFFHKRRRRARSTVDSLQDHAAPSP